MACQDCRCDVRASIGFVATVATEVTVQQIDHGPKVPAFLDVHLKEVAKIVKRRTRLAELSLLFDGSGFSVALRDDDPSQSIAKLAGYFLISGRP